MVNPKIYIKFAIPITMPMIYLKNKLYDRIVKWGENPAEFSNNAVEKALEKLVSEKMLKSKAVKE